MELPVPASSARPRHLGAILLAASLAVPLASASATDLPTAPITLQGSTVFNDRIIEPHRFEIERLAERRLVVVPNKSSHGLIALLEGRVDLAMISSTLEAEIGIVRDKLPDLAFDRLVAHEMARTRVAFARNPGNLVHRLTLAQLENILSGSITNWRDVGGADLPIAVVTVHAGGGVPSTVRAQVLGGRAFTPGRLIEVEAPRHVVKIVAQEAGALGVTQLAMLNQPGVAEVHTDRLVEQQLVLVSLGAPNAAQRLVIEAIRRFAEVPTR